MINELIPNIRVDLFCLKDKGDEPDESYFARKRKYFMNLIKGYAPLENR